MEAEDGQAERAHVDAAPCFCDIGVFRSVGQPVLVLAEPREDDVLSHGKPRRRAELTHFRGPSMGILCQNFDAFSIGNRKELSADTRSFAFTKSR